MGTASITAKFTNMRKEQDFIVYPIQKTNSTDRIMIQSDTRIGYIYLSSGDVELCPPVSSGAYQPHLMFAKVVDKLSSDELVNVKLAVFQTAGDKVWDNGMCIYCDNSKATEVLVF